jgi:hypothetical protein
MENFGIGIEIYLRVAQVNLNNYSSNKLLSVNPNSIRFNEIMLVSIIIC